MKAIVYTEYGSPDVLQFKDVEKPAPTDNEVLVKVHAASANPADWHLMRAEPFLARLANGLLKPKNTKLGADVAGRVEAIGGNVTQLRVGDDVFGGMPLNALGGFAVITVPGEEATSPQTDQSSTEPGLTPTVTPTRAARGGTRRTNG